MIPITAELDDLIKPASLREDEYLKENGLSYCRKCHTARQKRIEVSGRK